MTPCSAPGPKIEEKGMSIDEVLALRKGKDALTHKTRGGGVFLSPLCG